VQGIFITPIATTASNTKLFTLNYTVDGLGYYDDGEEILGVGEDDYDGEMRILDHSIYPYTCCMILINNCINIMR